jgi:LysM repeat protein
MRFIAIIILVFSSTFLWSQEETEASNFTNHTVEAGQTLYAISKKYNVSVAEIIADNPGVDKGLSVGKILKIRGKAPVVAASAAYVVKSGDTLYGIAKEFGISVEQLKELNNGLPAGLILGDTIQVPSSSANKVEEAPAAGKVLQDFDIAVMFPFFTSRDSLATRDYKLREASIHMYRGILAAADSLTAKGLRARIRVYDVPDNRAAVHAVLNRKEFQEVDLIIGPLFKDVIAEVAAWCTDHGAHMVVPVQQPNRILLNTPCLSKSFAGSVTQWMSIARYAHKNFGPENVVLIDSKILDDKKLVESFKEEWLRLTNDSLSKVVVCDDLANLKISPLLPSGKCLVAVPTADKKVISAVFRAVGYRSDIDVIGLESWDDLDFITTDMRNKYHLSYPQQSFLSSKSYQANRWQENYRRRFKTDPIEFAQTGYDVAFYFGCALKQFGKDFPNHWSEIKANTIGTKFDFFQSTPGSGYENGSVTIVRTENYQHTRAN